MEASSSVSSTCFICCENYNKTKHTKIVCGYCDFNSCRNCCEKYILSETIPKCMNISCGKEWSRKFLRDNFTKLFLDKRYKCHIENILYEKEKALMPATQGDVEQILIKRKLRTEIKELDGRINELIKLKNSLERDYYKSSIKRETYNYVFSCPNSKCRGFLDNNFKCGICFTNVCPDCREIIISDTNHYCDPNILESAKLLSKETKPCPKCHSAIYKIDGCDQMWCTLCHTTFDWKTGKLETNIHNPHYYEWVRTNGGHIERTDGVECGRELNNNTLDVLLNQLNKKFNYGNTNLLLKPLPTHNYYKRTYDYSKEISDLTYTVRHAIHNNRVIIPSFQTNQEGVNRNLRIQYLMNEINEEHFKKQIYKNDKKCKKNREIIQVIELSNTLITDILYRLIDEVKNSELFNKTEYLKYENEINEFINYCNSLFCEISYNYNCICYQFSSTLLLNQIDKNTFKKQKNTKILNKNKSNEKDYNKINDNISSDLNTINTNLKKDLDLVSNFSNSQDENEYEDEDDYEDIINLNTLINNTNNTNNDIIFRDFRDFEYKENNEIQEMREIQENNDDYYRGDRFYDIEDDFYRDTLHNSEENDRHYDNP